MVGEKGIGFEPRTETAAVYTKVFMLSVKTGHWETEKAWHKYAERAL
jgi:hypothetical protein